MRYPALTGQYAESYNPFVPEKKTVLYGMRHSLNLLVPPRVRHGLKTGLATALAYGVTQVLGMTMWQWAVVSALVAMQVTVADAIQAGLNRVMGTALGAALGIALLYVVPQNSLWLGVAIFAGTALYSSMSEYSPRYTMAALTVVVVLLAGVGHEDKMAVGIARMLEISLGVGCAILVSVILWPVRMADGLRRDLAAQYVQCSVALNTLVVAFLARQSSVDSHLLDGLTDKTWANHETMLRVRKHEALLYHYDHEILVTQVKTLDKAVTHMQPMLEALNDYEEEGFDVIMAPELRHLADAVMATLRHLGGSTPAAPVPDLVRNLTELVDGTETRLGGLRDQGATNRFNLHQMLQFYTFFHALRGMATDLLMALDRIQNRSVTP